MQLFGLKNCDTCRKALKARPELALVDVRNDGVPGTVLEKAFAQFGPALLNTRSTTWRGLDEAARTRPALELIGEHPALMKRPLILIGDQMFLGWSPDTEQQVRAAL